MSIAPCHGFHSIPPFCSISRAALLTLSGQIAEGYFVIPTLELPPTAGKVERK
jgi:hypothetical protein